MTDQENLYAKRVPVLWNETTETYEKQVKVEGDYQGTLSPYEFDNSNATSLIYFTTGLKAITIKAIPVTLPWNTPPSWDGTADVARAVSTVTHIRVHFQATTGNSTVAKNQRYLIPMGKSDDFVFTGSPLPTKMRIVPVTAGITTPEAATDRSYTHVTLIEE